MELQEIADLRASPITVTHEGLTLTLRINQVGSVLSLQIRYQRVGLSSRDVGKKKEIVAMSIQDLIRTWTKSHEQEHQPEEQCTLLDHQIGEE